ncbi:MAG: hypothetical protein JNM88_12785, partial [Chitinophagaceae bacterium]|nr:hypothetical protein [Chitinophagaceae bacterium]
KDWTREPDAAFGKRGSHQVTVFNNKMCVTGGFNETDTPKGDVWFSN